MRSRDSWPHLCPGCRGGPESEATSAGLPDRPVWHPGSPLADRKLPPDGQSALARGCCVVFIPPVEQLPLWAGSSCCGVQGGLCRDLPHSLCPSSGPLRVCPPPQEEEIPELEIDVDELLDMESDDTRAARVKVSRLGGAPGLPRGVGAAGAELTSPA